MLHNETITFSWETPEFEFKEKRKDWYWIVGVVGVLFIVGAILLKNYLFAFLIAIGAFLMVNLANKKPLSLPIEISDAGIKIYQDLYSYENLFAFWISENKKGEAVLLLLSHRRVSPIISITIDPDIDLVSLRDYLSEFIAEQEIKESFTDRVIDKIGF